MTKKQAEMIYKWAEPRWMEDEIESPDMLNLTITLFDLMRNDEPMSAHEAEIISEWGWDANSNGMEADSMIDLFRLILHEMINDLYPPRIEAMIDLATCDEDDVFDFINRKSKKASEPIPTSYPTEPEVIDADGGYYHCACYIDSTHYVTICNEDDAPGFNLFDRTLDDPDEEEYGLCEEFPCMNDSKWIGFEDFTDEQLALYCKMLKMLHDEMR